MTRDRVHSPGRAAAAAEGAHHREVLATQLGAVLQTHVGEWRRDLALTAGEHHVIAAVARREGASAVGALGVTGGAVHRTEREGDGVARPEVPAEELGFAAPGVRSEGRRGGERWGRTGE